MYLFAFAFELTVLFCAQRYNFGVKHWECLTSHELPHHHFQPRPQTLTSRLRLDESSLAARRCCACQREWCLRVSPPRPPLPPAAVIATLLPPPPTCFLPCSVICPLVSAIRLTSSLPSCPCRRLCVCWAWICCQLRRWHLCGFLWREQTLVFCEERHML